MSTLNSSCNDSFYKVPLIIVGSMNGIAAFACLIAAISLCALKLHNKSVYRLILYQVLASLGLSAVFVGQLFLIKYNELSTVVEGAYNGLCTAFAFFLMFAEWVKLVFTVWVTVHLFFFAVFFINLRRFEPMYVVTSMLIPAIISCVPLATRKYGPAEVWCWIKDWDCHSSTHDSAAIIEQFALWFGPCMAVLILTVVAMVAMLVIVVHRIYGRHTTLKRDQNWKALKQLLPLAIYPILFLVFNIMPFVNRLYGSLNSIAESDQTRYGLSISHAVGLGCWNLSTGLVVIIHVSVAGFSRKGTGVHQVGTHGMQGAGDCYINVDESLATFNNHTAPPSDYSTWFALPTPSIDD